MAFTKFSDAFDGRGRALAALPTERSSASPGRHHYDPHQPRIPRGHRDGGQWTIGWLGEPRRWLAEASRWSREANGEINIGDKFSETARKPRPPKTIKGFRKRNVEHDLFGPKPETKNSTVAKLTINGKRVYGVNSDHHTYTAADRAQADRMRATLIKKYPRVMATDNIGKMPNVSLYHAETTALLQAAKQNGGSLAKQTIEMEIDRVLCPSCRNCVAPCCARAW